MEYSSKLQTELSCVDDVWSTAQRQKIVLWCGNLWSTAQRQKKVLWCWQLVEYSSKRKNSFVWAMCGVQLKDRTEICCVDDVWSTAQRQKKVLWCGQRVEYSSKLQTELSCVDDVWSTAQRQRQFRSVGNVWSTAQSYRQSWVLMFGLNWAIYQSLMIDGMWWGWSCLEKGSGVSGLGSKEEREAEQVMEDKGFDRKHEGWLELERCVLPLKMDCLVLVRSPLGWGESGHPHLSGKLPD